DSRSRSRERPWPGSFVWGGLSALEDSGAPLDEGGDAFGGVGGAHDALADHRDNLDGCALARLNELAAGFLGDLDAEWCVGRDDAGDRHGAVDLPAGGRDLP